jgi:hypothetical protein
MTSLIIAVDDARRPTKSKALSGPEVGVAENRKIFNDYRTSGENPSGLEWVQLWTSAGQVTAHTPGKAKKAKAQEPEQPESPKEQSEHHNTKGNRSR